LRHFFSHFGIAVRIACRYCFENTLGGFWVMTFPVIATVKFCFTRIPRDWDIIWRYLQVPFLLCCLFGCVMLGIYVVAGPETFASTVTTENSEQLIQNGWYFAFTLSFAIIPTLILIPFLISWGRYALIGERGLEGRLSWSWSKPEWHVTKGGIMLLLVIAGWGIVFGLATGIPAVLVFMLFAALGLQGPIVTILAVIAGALYIAAFCVFLAQMTRLYLAFIPLAFGAPFKSETLWAVTKGKVWRYIGGLVLAGFCIGLPTWLVTLSLTSIIFGDDPAGPIKMQLLQNIFLLPVTCLSSAVFTAYYAEVWRYSGGHEEWSGAGEQIAQPAAETTPAQ
jgi:hypothetical protein